MPEQRSAGFEAEFADIQREQDWPRIAFWICVFFAVILAIVSFWSPADAGRGGQILLLALVVGGTVVISRDKPFGAIMLPRATADAEADQVPDETFKWLEALDEIALISDRNGVPVAANQAYKAWAAAILSDQSSLSDNVSPDRIFSNRSEFSEPVFRLFQAAKNGATHVEQLPELQFESGQESLRLSAKVSPIDGDRVLWRFDADKPAPEAKSSAKLGDDAEQAPIGFAGLGPDGRLLFANQWLRNLLGMDENPAHLRIDDLMRPESVKLLRRDRKAGAPISADVLIRSLDGSEIPVRAILNWQGEGSSARGRLIVLTHEQALTAREPRDVAAPPAVTREHQVDSMFDGAPFGAVLLSGESPQDAIIVEANRVLLELSHGKAVSGARLIDLFATEDGESDLGAEIAAAVHRPIGLKIVDRDDKHINLIVTADSEGRPLAAYVIDLSNQKDLELRLAQGEKMSAIGKLAGGVAHDFNNVLTGIILNNDHLMTMHPVGDPSFEHLKKIHEFSVRAKDLVTMLLAYARQQTFRREVFDPSDFLSEFSVLLGQLLDERVDFSLVHGRDLPMIKADKNQLETAIINLATNARDALLMQGGRGGKLTVRTSRATEQDAYAGSFWFVEPGEYLLIEIEDTGHGIAPEHLANIFNPFFTTKPKGLGTGLGLSTVYGIIKQSDGYICPISRLGEGTTFQIYLPALKQEDLPDPDIVQPMALDKAVVPVDFSGRGRILLVEDEDGVRSIAASQLRSRGYDVTESCDGEEALELLMADPGVFDLVVSDVVMPGMDGPTLIREAKDLLGDARILFMSGYAERDIAQQLDDNRQVAFMSKPFTVKQLAERVKAEFSAKSASGGA